MSHNTEIKTIEIVESNGEPSIQLNNNVNVLNKLISFDGALLRDEITEYDHPKGKKLTYEGKRKIKKDIAQLITDWQRMASYKNSSL
jgi:hypothetical protein